MRKSRAPSLTSSTVSFRTRAEGRGDAVNAENAEDAEDAVNERNAGDAAF